MANAQHIRAAATAKRLIAKHGRTLSQVTVTDGGSVYDPTPVETSEFIVGVQSNFSANEIDGDLIHSSDKKFLIDSTVALDTDMKITDGSTTYSIVAIDTIQPGDTKILYKAQVR